MAKKDATITNRGQDGEAPARALDEAAEEARRMARAWRDEAEGTHSSHQSALRRTWADAAERVAEAITALVRQDEAGEQRASTTSQHQRPHHL